MFFIYFVFHFYLSSLSLNLCFIKDVIRLETQYWTLIDIPRQEKQETVPSYVMRACAIMEKTQKSGEGVKTSAKLAEEAAEKRERLERLDSKFFCFYYDKGFVLVYVYSAKS